MISIEILKQVILDNQRAVEQQMVIPRSIDLDENMNYVLVGVRRAGKSFLLYQRMQQNLKQGIGWDQMLYINFEDERLINMEVSDLNLLLETFARIYGTERPILFLDELQNINGWEKFVRRLADNKYRLYITGSNAHMLSAEIATTLGGRFIMKEVYPYSFTEYLEARQVPFDMAAQTATATRAILQHHFDEYLQYGGFPEGAHLQSKRDYLMSVYQKIYLGDIAARHRIENSFALRFLFKKLSESIMQPMSFTRLTNLIISTGSKISKATVINYMDYAKEAYLIFPIKNISSHLSERESNPKYYFVDNGIISLLTLNAESALLENTVAMELLRRYGQENQVFFYNEKVEVDFYIPETTTAIQVCLYPHESDETWRRETEALIRFSKHLPCSQCLLITMNDEETLTVDGVTIQLIPAWKWLIASPK